MLVVNVWKETKMLGGNVGKNVGQKKLGRDKKCWEEMLGRDKKSWAKETKNVGRKCWEETKMLGKCWEEDKMLVNVVQNGRGMLVKMVKVWLKMVKVW